MARALDERKLSDEINEIILLIIVGLRRFYMALLKLTCVNVNAKIVSYLTFRLV